MGDRIWLGVGVSALIFTSLYGCIGPCADDCVDEPYRVPDAGADHAAAQPVSGAPTCYDENGAVTLWQFTGPVAHQNRCTSQQIAEIGAVCFGVSGAVADESTPSDASMDASSITGASVDASSTVDAGTQCDVFKALNVDCATCLVGAPYDGGSSNPSPIVIPVSADSAEQAVDTAGCVASLSTANATCKQNYEELSLCSHTACSVCSPADLQSCLTFASDPAGVSFCSPGLGTVDYTCNTLITSVPMGDQGSQCAVGSTEFASEFSIVANTMCGH
ncbi:MAG: hypothetical protein ABI461_11170 [Polyangiaceae bacterium]